MTESYFNKLFKLNLFILGSAFFAFNSNFASAAETNKAEIVQCMISNSTEEHKKAVAQLVIFALQENQPEIKKQLLAVGNMILDLALNKCSMDFQEIDKPIFAEIAGEYGEKVGTELMNNAFAKLH